MTEFDRRQFLGFLATAAASLALPSSDAWAGGLALGEAKAFSWDGLVEEARLLAKQAYRPAAQPDAGVLEQIDWEAHGKIRFKPEDALFSKGPGQYPVAFFHPGRFFKLPVRMYRLDQLSGKAGFLAHEILYDKNHFDMPADSPAQRLGSKTGYAGFRIQESRTGDQTHLDWRQNDWAAFLGASYFRAIGDEYQYGLSARGIAIDTAVKNVAEEFPAFTRFYFEPSTQDSDAITIYALLDGPSIAGAYRFVLTRSKGVLMDVDANLFLRRDVERFGIAPITSMYWFSQKDKPFQEDWRPEVHDSDGLALWTGSNEHVWRPLINPSGINVSYFVDKNPKGFGLMQRERHFDEYLDGVHYERRPGLWVEPVGDWGEGSVQLVELHTKEEIYDNVVAMWVPNQKARAGNSYRLSYRLHWQAEEPFKTSLARCVATRIGRGGEPGKRPPGVHKFEVEFKGGELAGLAPGISPQAVLSCTGGKISNATTEAVPDGDAGHWRAFFDLEAKETVDIRLFLKSGEKTLTETWLYQFQPA